MKLLAQPIIPIPTTSRLSRKHPHLSAIPAYISDTALPFTHHSLLITFLAQYPGILSAKPPPTAATSHLFCAVFPLLSFTQHPLLPYSCHKKRPQTLKTTATT
jgi:hypothetical protein